MLITWEPCETQTLTQWVWVEPQLPGEIHVVCGPVASSKDIHVVDIGLGKGIESSEPNKSIFNLV